MNYGRLKLQQQKILAALKPLISQAAYVAGPLYCDQTKIFA